jgi:hypothetical protein
MERESSVISLSKALSVTFLALSISGAANSAPETREAADQPFSNDSIWNTPLGQGVTFLHPNDPESQILHSDDIGGRSKSYAWIGFDATAVYRTKDSDPLVTWNYDARSATIPWPFPPPYGSVKLHTPKGIEFYGSTDHDVILIDPSGTVAYEVWLGSYDSLHSVYHATYIVRVDLKSSGISSGEGRSEGVRAFGGSLLGGLIRCPELAAGEIHHAVPVLISPTQARQGLTMADQKVWPAMSTDKGGYNDYAGLVPIGRLLAIPQSVNISELELTKEGTALARAFQQFGGYVVDTATNTMSVGAIEHGCNQNSIHNLFTDVRKIRDHLLPVANNDPIHVGGPGVRVAAPPPPLKQ